MAFHMYSYEVKIQIHFKQGGNQNLFIGAKGALWGLM